MRSTGDLNQEVVWNQSIPVSVVELLKGVPVTGCVRFVSRIEHLKYLDTFPFPTLLEDHNSGTMIPSGHRMVVVLLHLSFFSIRKLHIANNYPIVLALNKPPAIDFDKEDVFTFRS